MGFSNISGCSSIHTYEAAKAHWDRTPEPGRPGSTLREKWEGARPLDDASKWHYRVERGPDGEYFGVHLYHTEMVRYWRPQADGSRRVDYTNHGKSLSNQFMRRMGFGPELALELSLPGGAKVLAPVAYRELGTTIWYDKDGYLIKDRSSHAPVYRRVSSPEQKAWRKTLKESTRNLVTLFEMGMQVPEVSPNRWGRSKGRPFSSADISWDTKQALRYFDGELTENTAHLQIEALKAVWDACSQVLVDRRDYAAQDTGSRWRPKKAPPYKAPTPQEVTRSWYKQLERICDSGHPAKQRIEDWPAALPKEYTF